MYCFISSLIPSSIQSKLRNLGYSPLLLPPYRRLPAPAAAHPDMLIYVMPDGSLLTYGEYYRENRALFDITGKTVIAEETLPSDKYPHDVALNALRLGGIVFGCEKTLSPYIKNNADKVVGIKQGYANCSALVLDARTVITADTSIARAVKEYAGVIIIEAGSIRLDGYGCGFIGGASGRAENAVMFFGDPLTHANGKRITASVKERGLEVISLCSGELCDFGGIIFI